MPRYRFTKGNSQVLSDCERVRAGTWAVDSCLQNGLRKSSETIDQIRHRKRARHHITGVLGGQSEYSQLLKYLQLHSRLDRDKYAG
jgi:hypothetical protein